MRITTPALGRALRALVAGCGMVSLPANAAPPGPPRDPNDLPFLPEPNAQPRRSERTPLRLEGTPVTQRPRVRITALPLFAAFTNLTPFLGRPTNEPARGGGVALELDVRVLGAFGVRVLGSYTGHPLDAAWGRDGQDRLVQRANAGVLQSGHGGASLLYVIDFGRVSISADVGLGGLWIVSPEGVQKGQRGRACRDDGTCDTGLACATDNVCRVRPQLDVHAGFAVDVELAHGMSLGAGFRQFAFASDPGVFPVYLQASLRASIRF